MTEGEGVKLSLTVTAVGAVEFYEPISNEMNEMFFEMKFQKSIYWPK